MRHFLGRKAVARHVVFARVPGDVAFERVDHELAVDAADAAVAGCDGCRGYGWGEFDCVLDPATMASSFIESGLGLAAGRGGGGIC